MAYNGPFPLSKHAGGTSIATGQPIVSIQGVSSTTTYDITTIISFADAAPTITQGVEILSTNFDISSASDYITIDFCLLSDLSNGHINGIVALFDGTTSTCQYSDATTNVSTGDDMIYPFYGSYTYLAPGSGTFTYSLRAAVSTSSEHFFINPSPASSVSTSYMRIIEYSP